MEVEIIKSDNTEELILKSSSQKEDKINSGQQTPPYEPARLAELFELNVIHSRCIFLKAALVCMLGFNLVTDDDSKEPDDEYNRIMAFLEDHARYNNQSWLDTLYNFLVDYEIFGYNFLEVVRNGKGDVAEFYHMPGVNVHIWKTSEGKVYAKQKVTVEEEDFYPFGAEHRVKGKNEYLMMKCYTPRSIYYGIPEYIAATGAISLDRSAVEYNISNFKNNAVPPQVITAYGVENSGKKNSDNKTMAGLIKDFFNANFKGVANAGRALFLSTEKKKDDAFIEIKTIGSEIKDASFRNLRGDNKAEVAAAHGVPPRLVGIMTAGSLGGDSEAKQQMQMFRDLVIAPRQTKLEFLLNHFIIEQGLGIKKWKIQFERFDINDAINDATFFQNIMNIADAQGEKVLDVNEIREELGYKPREEDPEKAKQKKEKKEVEQGTEIVKALVSLKKALSNSHN